MRSHDFVVVGGGSAGLAAAARLSEDPAASVLLLEAGGGGTAPFVQVPNGIYFVKGSPRYHWLTEVEPDPTRNDRRETLTCGRGLGGGSSINGMVFAKGLPVDYDAWANAAGPQWSVDAVDTAFRRMDRTIAVAPPSSMHPIAQKFLDSARHCGLPLNDPDLKRVGTGVMPCPSSAARGWRQNTERAYLRPARRRPNLTVITDAVATRLVVRHGRVCAVSYLRRGKIETVHADEEVILSAGAINSPHLLMLSGIGPADHLRSLGIEPVLDRPTVGEGLQDHPCIWISVNVREKTWNDTLGIGGVVKAGAQWLYNRTGPAASAMCHVMLYGSTDGVDGVPDYQMSFMPAGYVVFDHGVEFLPSSSATVAVSLCRPAGRGSVRLRSADFRVMPKVSYRLLDTSEDIRTMTQACRAARNIFARTPIKESIVDEAQPGMQVQSDAQWEHSLRTTAVNMCHPVGSCAMGLDEASVVDPDLRLRGLDGLRIADASIMPTITSGNTNAPSIMIGERVAEFIRRDRAVKSADQAA